MKSDPKRLRTHRATLNFDEYEQKLINALVDYTGLSQAELLHLIVMKEARDLLLPESTLELARA